MRCFLCLQYIWSYLLFLALLYWFHLFSSLFISLAVSSVLLATGLNIFPNQYEKSVFIVFLATSYLSLNFLMKLTPSNFPNRIFFCLETRNFYLTRKLRLLKRISFQLWFHCNCFCSRFRWYFSPLLSFWIYELKIIW